MSTVYMYYRSDMARSEAGGTPGGDGYEEAEEELLHEKLARTLYTTLDFT